MSVKFIDNNMYENKTPDRFQISRKMVLVNVMLYFSSPNIPLCIAISARPGINRFKINEMYLHPFTSVQMKNAFEPLSRILFFFPELLSIVY
jgi:hypothetical protein